MTVLYSDINDQLSSEDGKNSSQDKALHTHTHTAISTLHVITADLFQVTYTHTPTHTHTQIHTHTHKHAHAHKHIGLYTITLL